MSANAETTVKFCVDCRYCLITEDPEFSLCNRTNRNSGENHRKFLVTGKKPPVEPSYCATQRDCTGQCGEDAKHFEPRAAK